MRGDVERAGPGKFEFQPSSLPARELICTPAGEAAFVAYPTSILSAWWPVRSPGARGGPRIDSRSWRRRFETAEPTAAAVLGPQLDTLPNSETPRRQRVRPVESCVRDAPALGFLKPEPRITRTAPYSYVLKYFAERAQDIRAPRWPPCSRKAFRAMACSMNRCTVAVPR